MEIFSHHGRTYTHTASASGCLSSSAGLPFPRSFSLANLPFSHHELQTPVISFQHTDHQAWPWMGFADSCLPHTDDKSCTDKSWPFQSGRQQRTHQAPWSWTEILLCCRF